MATSRGPGALPYVDPYDVDTLNPKEERTVEELWNAVPGGDKEIKSKAAVLKKYRKGFEGLFMRPHQALWGLSIQAEGGARIKGPGLRFFKFISSGDPRRLGASSLLTTPMR